MAAIDIVLPVYNGSKYLRESIESILTQSHTDFKLFIVDDCSIDDSADVIESYLSDERIVFLQNSINKGLFPSLNRLIIASDSPLVHLWAQDDIMDSRFLESVIHFHCKHQSIGFSYCAVKIINDEGLIVENKFVDYTPEVISPKLHDKISLYTGSIAGNICNVTIKRAALKSVGLFNEDMRMSGDFDMWIRLTKEYSVGRMAEPLIYLRNHSKQLSQQLTKKYYSTIEDLTIYKVLLNRVDDNLRKWGLVYFRRYKLSYYNNLAIKLLLKRQFKLSFKLFKLLNRECNFLLLIYYSFRNKFAKRESFNVPNREANNKFLFE